MQIVRKKKKNLTTPADKGFLLLVKQLPCIVQHEYWYDSMITKKWKFIPTGMIKSEAHHITHSGRRLGHNWVLPLSIENHRGDKGFSGNNRDAWDKSLKNQLKLCQKMYKVLGLEMPMPTSKVFDYEEILNG